MQNHNLNQINSKNMQHGLINSSHQTQNQNNHQTNNIQQKLNTQINHQTHIINQTQLHKNQGTNIQKLTQKINNQVVQQKIQMSHQDIHKGLVIQQNKIKQPQINNAKVQQKKQDLKVEKNQTLDNKVNINKIMQWQVFFIKQQFKINTKQQKIQNSQHQNQIHVDTTTIIKNQKSKQIQVMLKNYQQQLLQKKKQLNQSKQEEKIRQLESNIAQIENKIKNLQQPQNIYTEAKEEKQKKIVFSEKKKKKKQQANFNTIKQEEVKKLVIQLEQNKKGIKINRDVQEQQKRKKKQKNQKNQKISPPLHLLDEKMQIASNIYNFSICDSPLPSKNLQRHQQIKTSEQLNVSKQIHNQFSSSHNKEKKQKIEYISQRSQSDLQKQRLQKEVIILKKKLEQLELKKINQSRLKIISQEYNNRYSDHNIMDLSHSKIKLKDIFWHSDKKNLLNDDNIKMFHEDGPQIKINNPQKKFRSSLRPSQKKKLNKSLLEKTHNQSRLKQDEQIQTKNMKIIPVTSNVIQSPKKQLKMKDKKIQQKNEPQQNNNNNIEQVSLDIILPDMRFPKLPNTPLPYQTPKELMEVGRQVFALFGIIIDSKQVLNIKKFKNCIYFNIKNHHIIWHFEGKFYIGGWKKNKMEGEKEGNGIEFVPEKYLYQGNFKDGRRSGYGIMKYANGDKYQGDWIDGLRDGRGKFQQANGIVYQGSWKQGKKQGFGKLKISDQQIYEGNFQRNTKNGHGKEFFKNGDSYEGEYLHGKFCGKGIYKWANGSIYEGSFNSGCRNGYGIWKSNSNKLCDTYQGEYVNDKKSGKGKYIWENGSTYEGQFLNDLKHGEGTLRFIGGKILRGIWENGLTKKKLYSQQEQLYKQSKKFPKIQADPPLKNSQDVQEFTKKIRLSNKNIKNPEQKQIIQFHKETSYRKMQLNNALGVGDL